MFCVAGIVCWCSTVLKQLISQVEKGRFYVEFMQIINGELSQNPLVPSSSHHIKHENDANRRWADNDDGFRFQFNFAFIFRRRCCFYSRCLSTHQLHLMLAPNEMNKILLWLIKISIRLPRLSKTSRGANAYHFSQYLLLLFIYIAMNIMQISQFRSAAY